MSFVTDAQAAEPLWRCVRSKPKSEHLAARHLRVEGWEAYCPRVRHQKRTARGLVWFTEALFPGYVFSRFALQDHRLVRATTFVAGLLDFIPGCGLLPEQAVNDLRQNFPDDVPFTVEIIPAVGDAVEVAQGPLAGVSAVITRMLPGAQRVQILMDFLGSPRHMEVPLHLLLGFHDPRVAACAMKV